MSNFIRFLKLYKTETILSSQYTDGTVWCFGLFKGASNLMFSVHALAYCQDNAIKALSLSPFPQALVGTFWGTQPPMSTDSSLFYQLILPGPVGLYRYLWIFAFRKCDTAILSTINAHQGNSSTTISVSSCSNIKIIHREYFRNAQKVNFHISKIEVYPLYDMFKIATYNLYCPKTEYSHFRTSCIIGKQSVYSQQFTVKSSSDITITSTYSTSKKRSCLLKPSCGLLVME